jgi:excisionase family DNA binding protein
MHNQKHPTTSALSEASASAPINPADLLTADQVAQMLGVSTDTLATWRSTGRYALPFLRIGARIRYRKQDVTAWLNARYHTSSTPEVA